jgi:hypothetical protein
MTMASAEAKTVAKEDKQMLLMTRPMLPMLVSGKFKHYVTSGLYYEHIKTIVSDACNINVA